MIFRDLQSFLRHLEKNGLLKRIKMEVDPEYEITEIATRVVKDEGPALFFENVKGAKFPLAINFFGSHRHIEHLLGMHPEQMGEKLSKMLDSLMPPSPKSIWNARPYWSQLLATRPKRVGTAKVHEVVEQPNLDDLPIIKCWPDDGGRFITFPLVMTRDPVTRASNLGIYRMHVYSPAQTGMHMQIQKGGGFHYYRAEKRGEALPLACVLGCDPVLMLAGIFPLPEGLEETVFAGLMRGERTRLVKAKTVDINVPADAEFVLEGEVPPRERRMEGPFGDHFGHYSAAAEFPVFHVKTVTRRRNPVYPAAVVGRPPQEDRYMGEASQMILRPFVKMIRPELHDLWAYYEAGFHNLLVASVEGRYTKEPIKTALGLFGEGQLSLSKVIILVDPEVNVRDFHAVLAAIRKHVDMKRDFQLISRAPLDTLDFTSYKMHLGSKMIIDATGPEETGPPAPVTVDPAALAKGVRRWRILEDTLLAVQVEGDAGRALDTLVGAKALSGLKIIAAVSPDVDIEDDVELIWGIFTRFDPARDVRFTKSVLHGIKPIYEGLMGIDATFKKGYPDALLQDPETVKKVDERWERY